MKKVVIFLAIVMATFSLDSCKKENPEPQKSEIIVHKDCCGGENGTLPSTPGGGKDGEGG